MRNPLFFFHACLLLALALPLRPAAQPAAAVPELHDLLAALAGGDNYAYETTITSAIPGQAERQVIHMHNYQSRQQFIVYSRSEEALVFICGQGQLRVNPRSKTAYYAQYPADPARLQALKERMLAQASPALADSFLLAGAAVRSKTTVQGVTTWKLGYAPGAPLQGCTISAGGKPGAIVRVAYELERPLAGPGAGAVVRQQVVMDHYGHQAPAEVAGLLREAGDIRAYLERTCKGYQIETINL